MASSIVWKVAIVVQQDGDHCFEYADLLLSILNQPKFENVQYKILYYDQLSKTVSTKELRTDESPPFFHASEAIPTNIYNGRALTDFFSDALAKEPGVETRRMVILWAHGAGLGYVGNIDFDTPEPDFMRDITPVKRTAAAPRVAVRREKVTNYNKLMKHVVVLKTQLSIKGEPIELMDRIFHRDKVRLNPSDTDLLDERLQLITAVQLNTIFSNSLPTGKKIDVLITNSCYTQVLETGFALKDTVSVLISPQTTIPFTGFNYNPLFRKMEREPGLTLKELGKNVRGNFTRKYKDPHFRKNFRLLTPAPFTLLNEVSFSVNDLSHYQELIDGAFTDMAVRFFNATKGQTNQQLLNTIEEARAQCADISPSAPFNSSVYGIIDMAHFLRTFVRLRRKSGFRDFDVVLEQFDAVLKKIRLAWHKAAGPDEYSELVPSRSPHGLSFFFPANDIDADMTDLLIKVYKSKFGRQAMPTNLSKWPGFILRFRGI